MGTRTKSRAARWAEAVGEAQDALANASAALGDVENALSSIRDVQQEYGDWRDNLPENLQGSALGEKLEAVADLDFDIDVQGLLSEVDDLLSEAEGADLPMGFGRD